MSKRKNVDITHFFKKKHIINVVENNDQITSEEIDDPIAADPSSLSLNRESPLTISKEKNELNIFQPQSSEINLNKSLDIGDFLKSNSQINDLIKKQIIENHWRPTNSSGYPFSTHKKCGHMEKRFVKKEHLEKYFWLVVSKSMNGLFCIYCFLKYSI